MIYAAGTTTSATTGGPASTYFLNGIATQDSRTYTGTSNLFFIEIDPTGGYLLEATLAGGGGSDSSAGMAISNGMASIVGATNSTSVSTATDLFGSTNSLAPALQTSGDPGEGFLVQEIVTGFCNLQYVQVGPTLNFQGPCVSGTQGGTITVVDSSAKTSVTATITVDQNTLVGSATVNLSSFSSDDSLALGLAYQPSGATGTPSSNHSGNGPPTCTPREWSAMSAG